MPYFVVTKGNIIMVVTESLFDAGGIQDVGYLLHLTKQILADVGRHISFLPYKGTKYYRSQRVDICGWRSNRDHKILEEIYDYVI